MRNPIAIALSSANDACGNIEDKLDFLTYDDAQPAPADALLLIEQMLDSHAELGTALAALKTATAEQVALYA